jgi:superfamily II DNA/RNA helicase
VVFHKNIQAPNKDTLLQDAFQAEASGNVVVVTTDAMARGVDLSAISHVIQADFASTATDFLHRIGRTARAASGGKVTSLYRPAHQVLAETLQQYIEQGRPVEDCFSRNRSFSKKVKKFGKFVPRGQGGVPTEESGGDSKVGSRRRSSSSNRSRSKDTGRGRP